MNTMVLRGDKCQCGRCRAYFNSTKAFDKHRTGEHGVNRRCLSAGEMERKGMVVNVKGYWVTEPYKEYR